MIHILLTEGSGIKPETVHVVDVLLGVRQAPVAAGVGIQPAAPLRHPHRRAGAHKPVSATAVTLAVSAAEGVGWLMRS
jgi:hypothetical protein